MNKTTHHTWLRHMRLRHAALGAACATTLLSNLTSTQAQAPAGGTTAASKTTAPKGIVWQPLYEPGSGGAITAVAVSPHDPKHLITLGDMLGVATSFDGGDSWQPTFGFLSYEFSGGVTYHPTERNTVWIASATGPYKSTDRGINWVSKRKGMPEPNGGRYTAIVEKVLYDAVNPNRLLAFGGTSRNWNEADSFGWIWESTDGGENWRHIGTISEDNFSTEAKKGANIHGVQYEPGSKTRLHLRTGGGNWLISDDNGYTWRRHQPQGLPTKPRSITFHPKNANIVWVTTGSYTTGEGEATREPGGVYKSTDGGKTFVPSDRGITKVNTRNGGSLASNFGNVVVSPADPNVLFTNDGAWNASVIYKSTNGGANWFPVATRGGVGVAHETASQKIFNPKTATFAGISVTGTADPQSAERNYWYNTEFILRTRDGGKTWDDATAYQPDPKNKPDSWRGRGWVGWCATNFAWNPYRKGQAIAQAMDAGRAWISDDNLQSWRYMHGDSHPWLGGKDVTFTRDGHIYASTGQFGENNGLWRSRNWGKTWALLAGEKRGLPDAGWGKRPEYEGIYANPAQSNMVWAVLGDRLLHSNDAGESWKPVENSPEGARFIAGDPTKAGRFYIAARRGVFVTEDGQSFTNVGGPRPAGRGRINTDSQGRVLVCQWREGRTGVWRYTPATKMWQRLLDENLAFECVADPSDPKRLLMITNMDPFNDFAGGNGVWVSADDGKNWSRQDTGLAMLRGQAVAFNPHDPEQMVMGTFGRGFFVARWPRNTALASTRSYTNMPEDTAFAEPEDISNLARNAAMSAGAALPVNWDGKFGDITAARDTAVFRSGPASLRVDGQAGKNGQAFQQFETGAGKTYTVSGWVKTQDDAKVNFAVQSFAGDWSKNDFAQIAYQQGSTDWTQFSKQVRIPDWGARFNVLLMVEGAGSAWLDDVRVVAEGASPGTATVATSTQNAVTVTTVSTAAQDVKPFALLVKNGAMAQGLGVPQDWRDKDGEVEVALDKETFKVGPSSLRLEVKEGKSGNVHQTISGGANGKFTIGGWVKSQGNIKAQVAVHAFAEGWKNNKFMQVQYFQGDNDWIKFEKEVVLPEWTSFFRITLLAEGDGKAWLDEVGAAGEKVDTGRVQSLAEIMTTQASAKDKPAVAGWGFYPNYPTAWQQTFNGQLERTKQGREKKDINVVFLGDSITQGWSDGNGGKDVWEKNYAPLGAVNYGIGGDSTRQVLYRLQNGLVDGISPKLVVLKIGTNNLYGDFNAGSDEEIAAGITAVVKTLRQKLPQTKVLLLGVLPRQNDYFSNRAKRINETIAKIDDGRNVRYLDMSTKFQTEVGKVVPELYGGDQLHLAKPGYEMWAQSMAPLFNEMMK